MKKKKHDDSALSCSLIRRPIQRWGWLFLLPTFAAFCVGFLYPFAKGMFLSFCKFKTTSKWTWVGLKNYQRAQDALKILLRQLLPLGDLPHGDKAAAMLRQIQQDQNRVAAHG